MKNTEFDNIFKLFFFYIRTPQREIRKNKTEINNLMHIMKDNIINKNHKRAKNVYPKSLDNHKRIDLRIQVGHNSTFQLISSFCGPKWENINTHTLYNFNSFIAFSYLHKISVTHILIHSYLLQCEIPICRWKLEIKFRFM